MENTRKTKYTFMYRSADGHLMRPESFLNINKGRTLSSSQLRVLGITKVKLKDKISFEGGEILSLQNKLKKQFHDSRINELDGIKFIWDNSWIHFRKSNTEPILRIYAEAQNESDAKDLIHKAKKAIE